MQFYAMKLRELAKIAGTCKNCGNLQKLRFDEKEKKSDSPNTLFSLGYYLNVKSHFLLLLFSLGYYLNVKSHFLLLSMM